MESIAVKGNGADAAFFYRILWAEDFSGLTEAVREFSAEARKVCVITDSNVAPLYLNAVCDALKPLFSVVASHCIPAGEEQKQLGTVQKIYEKLILEHFDRKDLLVALGGGVVGDLTGFTAATYLRGVDFIQIPTTLLSQVDSSVGGKTGVDLLQFKNMVGAFYQPRLVYMNVSTLATLPEEQYTSGLGEVVKSALIRDRELFFWMRQHADEINEKRGEVLIHMIRSCCIMKASVVEEDPKDRGIRAILNYGHTIGHAIEKLKEFDMLHGHCVAVGNIAAAVLSKRKKLLSEDEFEAIRELQKTLSIPCTVKGLSAEQILQATRSDKKMESGQIKFILLDGIGHALTDKTITNEEILSAAAAVLE